MSDGYDSRMTNQVRLVGTLDTQRVRREMATLVERWNDVQGRERRAVLQVCSPFGKPFQVTLRLDAAVEGLDLLTTDQVGELLAVEGDLAWMSTNERRDVNRPEERGRQRTEVIARARRITPVGSDETPGCDIRLAGVVLTAPRVLRHPDRPVDGNALVRYCGGRVEQLWPSYLALADG